MMLALLLAVGCAPSSEDWIEVEGTVWVGAGDDYWGAMPPEDVEVGAPVAAHVVPPDEEEGWTSLDVEWSTSDPANVRMEIVDRPDSEVVFFFWTADPESVAPLPDGTPYEP